MEVTNVIPDWDAAKFYSWISEVDRLMFSEYAITISDVGIDEIELRRHWETWMNAKEFVEWFGIKYDLTPTKDWKCIFHATH